MKSEAPKTQDKRPEQNAERHRREVQETEKSLERKRERQTDSKDRSLTPQGEGLVDK